MSSRPPGFLTDDERTALSDPDTPIDDRLSDLGERFAQTLADFELLYMTLPDEAVHDLFTSDDSDAIRARAQHTLAFLYYGLKLTNDDVTHRITGAIEEAETADQQDATVTLDIVTQPFLPPEQRLAALRDGDFEQLSVGELDQLYYDDRIPLADLADAFADSPLDALSRDDLAAERDAATHIERMPLPVITNVEQSTVPPEEET